MIWIILVLGTPTPSIDMIELNTYAPNGTPANYTQVIFWSYSQDYKRYHAEAWCMENHCTVTTSNGITTCTLDDGRSVQSQIFRKTTTAYDGERKNRRLFPEENRLDIDGVFGKPTTPNVFTP